MLSPPNALDNESAACNADRMKRNRRESGVNFHLQNNLPEMCTEMHEKFIKGFIVRLLMGSATSTLENTPCISRSAYVQL